MGAVTTAQLSSRTTVYDLVNISCVLGYEYNFQWRGDRLLHRYGSSGICKAWQLLREVVVDI